MDEIIFASIPSWHCNAEAAATEKVSNRARLKQLGQSTAHLGPSPDAGANRQQALGPAATKHFLAIVQGVHPRRTPNSPALPAKHSFCICFPCGSCSKRRLTHQCHVAVARHPERHKVTYVLTTCQNCTPRHPADLPMDPANGNPSDRLLANHQWMPMGRIHQRLVFFPCLKDSDGARAGRYHTTTTC